MKVSFCNYKLKKIPKIAPYFFAFLFLFLFPLLDSYKNLNSSPRDSSNPRQTSEAKEFRRKLVQIFSEQNKDYFRPDEIKIKKDNKGELWLLETGRKPALTLRHLNRNSAWYLPLRALGPLAHSFDFAFDRLNEPWLVWIESDSMDHLWLTSPALNRLIMIDSGPAFSLTSPSISIDSTGLIWIFWAKSFQGLEQIFVSRFSDSVFPLPEILFPNEELPCLMPASYTDNSGRLWLAWSAYDGSSYDVFISSYDGQNWSRPIKISSSPEADLLPRFFPSPTGDLILCWWQAGKPSSCLWLMEKRNNKWQKPEILWSDSGLIKNYEIIASENDFTLFLTKERGNFLYVLPRRKADQKEKKETGSDLISSSPFLSFNRNDDAYIAFGDSVTSGLIKTSLDPELYYYNGYPTRLELKLETEYGAGEVHNEGLDGELTLQGVSRLPVVLNQYNARYLLLMEGFNDVIFTSISLDTIIFNLQTMINQARQKGVFPLLATITPRRDSIWYQPLYRQRHLALNDRIRQLAPAMKVPLVDQYAAMENYPAADGGLLSLLSVDLKHPNEKGYEVIAETWFKEIQVFPFPPQNLKVVRRDFVWEAKFIRFLNLPEFLPDQTQNGSGNFISWEANPKTKNLPLLAGYRLYRKKTSDSDSAYALIATIKDNLHYLDKNVILSLQYSYLVSAYRTDGVEGPAAGPVIR